MAERIKAHDLHIAAEEAREQDRLVDALPLLERAIVGYQQERNYAGIADALSSKVLVYKHLFYTTQDKVYVDLAQSAGELSLAIMQKHNLDNQIHVGYFRLGEIAMLVENYPQAIANYEQALTTYKGGTNAEHGDYQYHLGEAMYRSGDHEQGKALLLQGLQEITDHQGEVDPFLAHVWQSGCYLRLAELLAPVDHDSAVRYLGEAEKIIHDDPKLVIRKRQLAELREKLALWISSDS